MSANPFAAAEHLAPVPTTPRADTDDWVRHYAAQALAAWAVFHRETRHIPANPVPGSRPDIGYLAALGVASTHAAIAITTQRQFASEELWLFTPEEGSLNGEVEDWAVRTLDTLGVNPADIDDRYEAADFRSPSRVANAAGGA